jgi:plastocyanin
MHLHLRKLWPALLLLVAAPSVWAATHTVSVGGTYESGGYTYPSIGFTPRTVAVNVGDTVTFTNAGGTHNVDADDETSFRCANGCDGAGGNGNPSDAAWSSTITITPAMAGHQIGYHCDVHGSMGMTGTIVVSGTGGGTTNVPISAGFTGAWYDPNQSGHGIFLEVLANNQILAWWFTFAPDGTQAWFGNVGGIDPATNTATVAALKTQGGAWIPNFNPANVTQPVWGTLVFSFTDCNHGRVDFNSSVTGYGQGHMDLTRITQIDTLSCP